jgi:hypothetical protein
MLKEASTEAEKRLRESPPKTESEKKVRDFTTQATEVCVPRPRYRLEKHPPDPTLG